jgi:hypothetical protein
MVIEDLSRDLVPRWPGADGRIERPRFGAREAGSALEEAGDRRVRGVHRRQVAHGAACIQTFSRFGRVVAAKENVIATPA